MAGEQSRRWFFSANFIVACLIIVAVSVGYTTYLSASANYELAFITSNTGGITRHSPVMFGGVMVGRVEHIQPVQNTAQPRAVIRLRIFKKYCRIPAANQTNNLVGITVIQDPFDTAGRILIPTNAIFSIDKVNLLADQVVSISPPRVPKAFLKNSDNVYGQASLEMGNIFGEVSGYLSGFSQAGKLLGITTRKVSATLASPQVTRDASLIKTNLERIGGELGELKAHASEVGQANEAHVQATLENYRRLTNHLALAAREFQSLAAPVKEAVDSIQRSLGQGELLLAQARKSLRTGRGLAGLFMYNKPFRSEFKFMSRQLQCFNARMTQFGLAFNPELKENRKSKP